MAAADSPSSLSLLCQGAGECARQILCGHQQPPQEKATRGALLLFLCPVLCGASGTLSFTSSICPLEIQVGPYAY